jgi:drug/metabolite transporter (DMT)-like permease
MPPLIAALVLLSALLHALWNASLKRQPDPEGASVAILAIAALVAAAIAAALGWPLQGRAGAAWSLAAGLCDGGYFVTLALALRDAPLGTAYALSRGGALAVAWPLSVALLGEAITGRALGGVALLLAGLAAVGLEHRRQLAPRGGFWAALCALFIAAYHLCYKRALATGSLPAAVFATALAVALPLNLARLGPGGPGRALAAVRRRPVEVGAAGAICAASFLVFLSALAAGGAGATLTLRNTSVVFAVLLAWLLGERQGPGQVAGVVGIAAGAVLLAWPT